MKTADVNKNLIGRRCECICLGTMVTGEIIEVNDNRYTSDVKVCYDQPQRWRSDLYTEEWIWGRKDDEFGPLQYLRLLPEPAYKTLIVTFAEPINILEGSIFDDPQAWGATTLKEWIDGYESTRFTQVSDRTAVITSAYNMGSVREWLEKHTKIETLKTA